MVDVKRAFTPRPWSIRDSLPRTSVIRTGFKRLPCGKVAATFRRRDDCCASLQAFGETNGQISRLCGSISFVGNVTNVPDGSGIMII